MLSEAQKGAAEMLALKAIGIEDACWILKCKEEELPQEFSDYVEDYGKEYDNFVLKQLARVIWGKGIYESYDEYLQRWLKGFPCVTPLPHTGMPCNEESFAKEIILEAAENIKHDLNYRDEEGWLINDSIVKAASKINI